MHASLKLSAYGAALAVLVAGTYAVGSAVGSPTPIAPPAGHADEHGAPATEPGGLATSRAGYTLVPDDPALGSGTFAFRILDFQVGGVVRTAEFTATTGRTTP